MKAKKESYPYTSTLVDKVIIKEAKLLALLSEKQLVEYVNEAIVDKNKKENKKHK